MSQILDINRLFTSEFSRNFKLFFDRKVRKSERTKDVESSRKIFFLCQKNIVEFYGRIMASLEYSRALNFGKQLVIFSI